IKKLLYEEEYTIAGSRKKLDEDPAEAGEMHQVGHPAAVVAPAAAAAASTAATEPRSAAGRTPSAPVTASRRAAVDDDHPVDLLAARIEKRAAREAPGRQEARASSDADREARLDKALGEIRKQLKEVLALLRQE